MGLPNIVGETLPAVLVELRQVGLVFGVHDVYGVPTKDHDVGYEMAEASVGRVGPLDGKDGFPLASDAHDSTIESSLSSDESLNVVLPELLKMKRPSDTIHLPSTAKPSLVGHPP
jgi:hypothetical protein